MDYKDFVDKVGNLMDIPTDEQKLSLIEGEDSIHVSVGIGYVLKSGEVVTRESVSRGEYLILGLDLLLERGAVRGKDYILCLYPKQDILTMTLHTTHSFLSDEDFDSSVKRL